MAAAATTKSQPLTRSEKWWSACLVVLGIVCIVGVVAWLAGSTGGVLKSETTKTTEPAGQNASGTKQTSTDKYSENVVLAALGIGAALLVAGAFYGRIREITLPGGVSVGLGPPKLISQTNSSHGGLA